MDHNFTPDLTNVAATIKVFDKGIYEFSIGAAKPFKKAASGDKAEQFGIRYPLKVEAVHEDGEPDQVGKGETVFTCYLHNEGGQGMSKQFVMAGYGYRVNDEGEEAFNEAVGSDADWAVNFEDGTVGTIWGELAGKRILAELDSKVNKANPDQKFQNFSWIPLSALEAIAPDLPQAAEAEA